MFTNYFITACRNLWKYKAFSLINIAGLGLGLACSLLIMLWVFDEYNQDAFHRNGTQLYSVFERRYNDGTIGADFATQGLMAGEMKRVFPEVAYATGFAWNKLYTYEANNKILKVNGNYADKDFFTMFSYPLLLGDPATALQSPLDIAISEKMARDFFGGPSQAIGKTIRFENKKDFTVKAVFGNLPVNSSMQFDCLMNWPAFLQDNGWAESWDNNGPLTYLMLRQGTDTKAFERKITGFLDNYNKDQTATNYTRLGLQRYPEGYLHSGFKNAELSGGRIQYVRIFSIVAIFILLIACINFINLTTARSLQRAKEIGVRKVIGAQRSALIWQFMGEAFLLVVLAVCFALAAVVLLLPAFNALTQKQTSLPLNQPYSWLFIAGLVLLTSFISGSYPALYLSGFNPLGVLKGSLKFSGNALLFRKSLVVFQFVIAVMLITGTLIISKQVAYIGSIDLGFDRENLVYIPFEGDLKDKYALFREQALKMPGIQAVSRMDQSPTGISNGTTGIKWEGKNPASRIEFSHASTGYDFTRTMHAQITMGRDFSRDIATDSAGYIINETALKITGYKDPVGRPLTLWGKRGTIIGVVKDFHFNSLHTAITPLVLHLGEKDRNGIALVRTQAGKTKEALAGLETICKNLNPKFPFTFTFSDEAYQKLYGSEQVIGKLSNWFAGLAIFISCLGLLGLVMFTAQQRTKEFGIRKVLGASAGSLFSLLSKEFLLLVLLAMAIASPISWLAMTHWLEDYSYHIPVTVSVFVVAGLSVLVIALMTISFQAIKMAIANPVKSLRTE